MCLEAHGYNTYKCLKHEKNQNSQRGIPNLDDGNPAHLPYQCIGVYTLLGSCARNQCSCIGTTTGVCSLFLPQPGKNV